MNPARKFALASALVGAAVVGGAVGANVVGTAGAQTSSSSSSSTTAPAPTNMPAHGSADHENAEKAVTGDAASKAQAAAVASVGSGTAGDVTTDFTGQGYETTVTKADGTQVEVHLDSSFTVMQHGGPGGPGGPGAPGAAASGSSTGA
jgi:hypothetical protein